jgi:hypothetical protein
MMMMMMCYFFLKIITVKLFACTVPVKFRDNGDQSNIL